MLASLLVIHVMSIIVIIGGGRYFIFGGRGQFTKNGAWQSPGNEVGAWHSGLPRKFVKIVKPEDILRTIYL